MIIHVGSKNPAKLEAVREIVREYHLLNNAQVIGFEINSKVSEQPKSLEETVEGAISRASIAFLIGRCDYGFGIESGLIDVPKTKTGKMDICVCAIYDGEKTSLGMSSAFEYPIQITKMILEDRINASEAALKIGLTNHPYVGHDQGIIGIITKGRVTRKDYTKQAIQMALIQLENRELY